MEPVDRPGGLASGTAKVAVGAGAPTVIAAASNSPLEDKDEADEAIALRRSSGCGAGATGNTVGARRFAGAFPKTTAANAPASAA
ncbi:MAG: hypothetical protein DVS81_02600 [Candidatus Accumulibacter meliphilus]|uniref:Uncharacterized protein n=1 Tax=Candidatus Accumulibacter meliphilus TaxID=2211374 RepID=A0A369XUQ8_9PROT|nr:MAG: hypothetical protein DVS81_02600 [Candidatus Accumulibacter meliphilus]